MLLPRQVDFVHRDNLINGLLLAAQGLTSAKKCIAAGKVRGVGGDLLFLSSDRYTEELKMSARAHIRAMDLLS